MDWQKLSPWNWLKHEEEGHTGSTGEAVPVRRGELVPRAMPRSVSTLHDEIDRIFDNVFRGFGVAPWQSASLFPSAQALLRPSIDIAETPESYQVTVEVPGVAKEDVEITVRDDSLVVRGEKRREEKGERGGYHYVERSAGAFQRVLSLPANADRDHISADFKDGVLEITVNKLESEKPDVKKIEISA